MSYQDELHREAGRIVRGRISIVADVVAAWSRFATWLGRAAKAGGGTGRP